LERGKRRGERETERREGKLERLMYANVSK
jgi:hypothetical protein